MCLLLTPGFVIYILQNRILLYPVLRSLSSGHTHGVFASPSYETNLQLHFWGGRTSNCPHTTAKQFAGSPERWIKRCNMIVHVFSNATWLKPTSRWAVWSHINLWRWSPFFNHVAVRRKISSGKRDHRRILGWEDGSFPSHPIPAAIILGRVV